MTSPLLSAQDVAAHFNVSHRTILRLANEKRIPHRRIGRQLRFVLSEVETALRVDAVSEEARQRPAKPRLSRNIASARRLPSATWPPPTRRSTK